MKLHQLKSKKGSIELITLGLLAALLIVLAIPLLVSLGDSTEANLGDLLTEMGGDLSAGI